MQKSGILLIAASMTLAGGARTQEAQPPLFVAFKSFCADTEAQSDAVKRAVEAAGGKPQNPSMGSTTEPNPMSTSLWDITVGGHKMIVAAGSAHSPDGPNRFADFIDCQITSYSDEDSSIVALGFWAGVPPSSDSATGQTYYNFQQQGSARTAWTDNRAVAEGRTWLMTVSRSPHLVSVQLLHNLGTSPAGSR